MPDVKAGILLVDDEEAILLAFKKMLQTPSVPVDTAQSVDEARQLLAQKQFAAVIADLRLSGAATMDGFDVISEAKKTQPQSKVIVITAYGGSSTKEEVFRLGADMYLEKPVSPHTVKGILASMGVY
jgi:two-component system, response regulator, stage 0 sporulation protein F